jgi:hypothetical protein
MKPNRPFSVTFLAVGVLSIAVTLLVRAVTTFIQNTYLSSLPLSATPTYLGLTGLMWGTACLVSAVGLWFGRVWAPKAVQGIAIIFTVYYWFEQIAIMENPLKASNWPFLILLNLALLVTTFIITYRPQAKSFFGDKHE